MEEAEAEWTTVECVIWGVGCLPSPTLHLSRLPDPVVLAQPMVFPLSDVDFMHLCRRPGCHVLSVLTVSTLATCTGWPST